MAPSSDGTFGLVPLLDETVKMPLIQCPVCFVVALENPPYERWDPSLLTADVHPPYEELFGAPSYDVCPSCGFEFGNDDNPGTAAPVSFEAVRAEWIDEGRPIFEGGLYLPEGSYCVL